MPKQKHILQLAIAAIAAFSVYTCMVAFRKPFTAATFSGQSFLNVDYKIWLVVAQTLGYTLSKFYGIKFISEMKPHQRARLIIIFICIAWLALLFFALVPAPYNIFFLVVNGFPLGMLYGLVFSYLEGRRATEVLGAVLATSFIFAAGFSQSIGKYVMLNWGVSEFWMPFVTGAIFFLPTLFFTWLLNQTPPPTAKDIEHRTARLPMTKEERWTLFKTFWPGLVLLIISYIMLSIVRDYRSNFASNIWKELGQGDQVSLFTQTEIPASLVTLFLMSLLVLIKSNIRAFMVNHLLIIGGFVLSIVITYTYIQGFTSAFWWMTLTGVGLYMGYVPFNAMLFDRMIASFKYVSNAGFIIYLADSFAYLGSDAVLIMKNFLKTDIKWSSFFEDLVLIVSTIGVVMVSMAAVYFRRKYKTFIQSEVPLKT
jgi:MFS family permease